MPKETWTRVYGFHFVIYILLPLLLPIWLLVAPFIRLYIFWCYSWFQGRFMGTLADHRRKVARIQEQVKRWNAGGRKKHMCSSRPAWVSTSIRSSNNPELQQIQTHDLNQVLEVDTERRILFVEPGVTMGTLTTILIPLGWTIPVVPELENLSVGGLVCGAGLESTSATWGMFGDIPIEYEVVMSNGELIICSKEENRDVFDTIPWSHGTIGFLVGVKLPLIPAKKYVQLEYHPARSDAEAHALLSSTETHQFIEGIAYARDKMVVTLGNMVDKVDPRCGRVNHINRWYKPFFFRHVESFLIRGPRRDGKVHVEYYPLRDYYHRHTRSLFWGPALFIPYSESILFRYLFGWFFPLEGRLGQRMAYALGIHRVATKFGLKNSVIQDLVFPMKHFEKVLDYFHNLVQVYPLWLCPTKQLNTRGLPHVTGTEGELYFDYGVYGAVHSSKRDGYDFLKANREIEAFVLHHSGLQALYGPVLSSRQDFARMFDRRVYDDVRTRFQCHDAFPDLYDKILKQTKGIMDLDEEI